MATLNPKHKPYPAYKPSGVERLREVPAHWEVQRLRYTSEMRVSNVDKHTKADELPVYLCNYADVYNNEHITSRIGFMPATATSVEIARFRLEIGDVLITKDSETWDDIGVPALVEHVADDLICGYHLALLRPVRSVLYGGYLLRALQSPVVSCQLHVEAKGVTRYGLTHDSIKSVLLPIPSLAEQRAIAAFLDQETAKIDALVSEKERLVELLQEKRTALISHTVTRGLDPNPPKKASGVEWLGEIPTHWEVKRLKSICRFAYGDSLPAEARTNEGISVYGSNGVVGFHSFPNTNGECLIIGRKGSFGKVHYSTDPAFAIDTTFFVDERTTDANIRWLYYLLQSLNLDVASKDSAVPGLSRDDAYQQVAPCPPFPEQSAIAIFLDRETTRLDNLIAKVHEAVRLLRELRTALISAAVTGKIDVREDKECM